METGTRKSEPENLSGYLAVQETSRLLNCGVLSWQLYACTLADL